MDNNDLRSYRLLRKYKVISAVNGLLLFKDAGFRGVIGKVKKKREYKKEKADSTLKNIVFEDGKVIVVVGKDVDLYSVTEQLQNKKISFQFFQLSNRYKNGEILQITNIDLNKYFRFRSFVLITNQKVSLDNVYFATVLKNGNNLYEKIENLLTKLDHLKLLANYTNINNINVKTSTFFDYDGGNYYSGGAERYLIDLHDVCAKMGYNLDIYQNANKPYFRKFSNINVIGLPLKDLKPHYSENFMKKQTDNYIYSSKSQCQLNIYSAFQECWPKCFSPSIGISHGVSWDHKFCKAYDGIDFWQNKRLFIESAQMCDRLVSVDTNTANWFQTIDFDIGNQKFKVIPNYVDTKEFSPSENYLEKKEKIVITYPRRLYEARGLYLALEAADLLLKKYKNLEFRFVGKGFDEDLNRIKEYQKRWPNKILCYSCSPYEMYKVYKDTDISLIPTLYSEGTSLSCLEAMSSGNFVIASRIGGLTDLIINGYNGFLIEPTVEDFYETIENIILHYDELSILRKRAIETAQVMNKDIWKERWTKILKQFSLNKKGSNNIDLVEFYLPNISAINDKIRSLIQQELSNNSLVYLRLKKLPKDDIYSGNRLQLVSIDDEVVSKPAKVYISSDIKENEIDCDEIIKL